MLNFEFSKMGRTFVLSPTFNVYSKFGLSSSVNWTCAYQIEQLCTYTSDWSDYLNAFQWSLQAELLFLFIL